MRSFLTRALAGVLMFALFAVPASAQGLAGNGVKSAWTWEPLQMRNTSAASVAQNLQWSSGGGVTPSGFVDSTVFRRAVSATGRDTSVAIHVSKLLWPPHVGPGSGLALSDTTMHTPWIALRIKQDTLSYSWTGGTAMDSFFVAAQWSPNGINWYSAQGTPTRLFEATNGAADENGVTPILVGGFAEPTAPADIATAYLGCVPALAPVNSTYIVNQTLCMCEGFIRFIFVLDGTGQFAPEIAYWKHAAD